MRKSIQLLLIVLGMLIVIMTSDGTWETASGWTISGMVMAIVGMFMGPLLWLWNKISNLDNDE
jgi:hypothetical protein